jgi:CRP/FNR family transcriptional regulator, cyclic AMP receptor protein
MITTAYDLLAAHPFLAGMSPAHLDRLTPWAHRSLLHEGKRIFSEGSRAERFWLIREGTVALDTQTPSGDTVVVEELGPGAVLGWSWLFPPYRWHLGATAVTQTLAVELDGAGVRRVCEEDPEIGADLYRRFIEVVVDRLQATRQRFLAGGDTSSG